MPGLFEQFPHTNLHELNLDWIIDMINQFKEELEDSAVLSVNGQTGHVTLYESENVILPPLPSGVDQWRLVRMMDGQYVGIMFYNNHAYFQRGNETMRLLTLEDIPSDSGVVSWNGLTGVVNVTGADIPVDDSADADSIEQAISNETTERTNADSQLRTQLNAMNNILANTPQNATQMPMSASDSTKVANAINTLTNAINTLANRFPATNLHSVQEMIEALSGNANNSVCIVGVNAATCNTLGGGQESGIVVCKYFSVDGVINYVVIGLQITIGKINISTGAVTIVKTYT